jgi:hypothetical protein
MTTTTERAAATLELLPEEMREPAVAYLLEQAERFRVLKELVAEGIDDVKAGRCRMEFSGILARGAPPKISALRMKIFVSEKAKRKICCKSNV